MAQLSATIAAEAHWAALSSPWASWDGRCGHRPSCWSVRARDLCCPREPQIFTQGDAVGMQSALWFVVQIAS